MNIDPVIFDERFGLVIGLDVKSMMLELKKIIDEMGYEVEEVNDSKPWGGYYRLANKEAERFIGQFFPGLTMQEACLGLDGVELSPKFLLVAPAQRLSWQFHDRRAERWRFLTKGAYNKSLTDDEGDVVHVEPGHVVQFGQGERHRLCAYDTEHFTLVAEIWQHVDPAHASDEDDIVRLQDDYTR